NPKCAKVFWVVGKRTHGSKTAKYCCQACYHSTRGDIQPTSVPYTKYRQRFQITDNGRICIDCGVWKSWADFRTLKHGLAKHEGRCKECYRWYTVCYLYKITRQEWEWLFALQGGGCALCGEAESNPRLTFHSVDHDHSCCGKKFACKS